MKYLMLFLLVTQAYGCEEPLEPFGFPVDLKWFDTSKSLLESDNVEDRKTLRTEQLIEAINNWHVGFEEHQCVGIFLNYPMDQEITFTVSDNDGATTVTKTITNLTYISGFEYGQEIESNGTKPDYIICKPE